MGSLKPAKMMLFARLSHLSQVSASSFISMALDFHASHFQQLERDEVPVTKGLMWPKPILSRMWFHLISSIEIVCFEILSYQIRLFEESAGGFLIHLSLRMWRGSPTERMPNSFGGCSGCFLTSWWVELIILSINSDWSQRPQLLNQSYFCTNEVKYGHVWDHEIINYPKNTMNSTPFGPGFLLVVTTMCSGRRDGAATQSKIYSVLISKSLWGRVQHQWVHLHMTVSLTND